MRFNKEQHLQRSRELMRCSQKLDSKHPVLAKRLADLAHNREQLALMASTKDQRLATRASNGVLARAQAVARRMKSTKGH